MLTTMKTLTLLTIGFAMVLASTAHASQELLAKSIKEVRAEASRTSEQLKATLSALNALAKQSKGDLRPAYKAYCSEVARTETAAGLTGTRVQSMASDGRQYFQGWQNSINGIANQSLRKKFQKRLDSAKASYQKVEASLQLASDKFKPFLSDLGDIQKALATDVTAAGVSAVRSTVKTANWNHQFVNQAINSALKDTARMEKSLSSEAK